MNHEGNSGRDRLVLLGSFLAVFFASAVLIVFCVFSADAVPANRSPIDLPPVEFTPSDITPTEKPTQPTEKPTQPTEKPTQPTEKPTEPTEKPTEPTEKPTEPTEPISIDRFTDVKADSWYYDGVKYAIQNGLMNGVSETGFAPDSTLTRAMLVTVLYRLADQPDDFVVANPFKDVQSGKWYHDAVIWAYQEKVANGTSETTFAPSAPVTREQLVTFLWRYVGEPTSSKELSAFPDAGRISSYAYTAVQWAVEKGIINGKSGKIDPKGFATRAEIAVIFMRSAPYLS